jgi:hypothetical protein
VVLSLESDLDFERFARFNDAAAVQQIAFNILLTVSFWSWDDASYSKDLFLLLIPFLESTIKTIEGETAATYRGDRLTFDELEAEVFWHFTCFYRAQAIGDFIRPSNQTTLKRLFAEVKDVLKSQLQDLLQVFGPRMAAVLDILCQDCRLWFAGWFAGAELRRLWTSIAGFSSFYDFFRCFIVAILYAIAPDVDTFGDDTFIEAFQMRKKELDLGVLLTNVEAVIEIFQGKAKERQKK